MRAVIELEAMGFRFFVDEGPDPSIGYNAPETADPLVALFHLRRIQRNKKRAIKFIRTNNAAKQFTQLYEQWAADPDPSNDANYINQLADVATSGNMPIYLDGLTNAGPEGWRAWAAQMKELLNESQEVQINENEKQKALPWETKTKTHKQKLGEKQ